MNENTFYELYIRNDLDGIQKLLQGDFNRDNYMIYLFYILEKAFLDKYDKSCLYLLLTYGEPNKFSPEIQNYINGHLKKHKQGEMK